MTKRTEIFVKIKVGVGRLSQKSNKIEIKLLFYTSNLNLKLHRSQNYSYIQISMIEMFWTVEKQNKTLAKMKMVGQGVKIKDIDSTKYGVNIIVIRVNELWSKIYLIRSQEGHCSGNKDNLIKYWFNICPIK